MSGKRAEPGVMGRPEVLGLHVRVSPALELFLDKRHFDPVEIGFTGQGECRIKVTDRTMAGLIRESMACELRSDETILHRGRVDRTQISEDGATITIRLAGSCAGHSRRLE